MPQPPINLLSVVANIERHKIASTKPWLLLMDIEYPGDTNLVPGVEVTQSHVRFVRDLDPFTFDAGDGNGPQVYQPFNFEIGEYAVGGNGSLPSCELRASNVMRVLQSLIEQYEGVVGANLYLYVVNTANPTGEADLSLAFTIMESPSDSKLVRFKLGASSPLRRLFPIHKYRPNFCIWQFNSPPLQAAIAAFTAANPGKPVDMPGVECGYQPSVFTASLGGDGNVLVNVSSLTGVAIGNLVTNPSLPTGTEVVQYSIALPVLLTMSTGSPVVTLQDLSETYNGVPVTFYATDVAVNLSAGTKFDLPGGGTAAQVVSVSGTSVTLNENMTTTGNVACVVEMNFIILSAAMRPGGTNFTFSCSFQTCDRTIDGTYGCKAHNNLVRIGTFPGIDTNGYAVASVA